MTVYEALNLVHGFGHLVATIILIVVTIPPPRETIASEQEVNSTQYRCRMTLSNRTSKASLERTSTRRPYFSAKRADFLWREIDLHLQLQMYPHL
jgi:hypothetical protein